MPAVLQALSGHHFLDTQLPCEEGVIDPVLQKRKQIQRDKVDNSHQVTES